jgi:hypothetical protein
MSRIRVVFDLANFIAGYGDRSDDDAQVPYRSVNA